MNKTVGDLVDYLLQLDQSSLIIFSKDAEGNNYSPWAGDHSSGYYYADSTWTGDFYSRVDVLEEPDDYPHPDEMQKAIVLWPIN